jgi:pilus assembly protein Flp/PilA
MATPGRDSRLASPAVLWRLALSMARCRAGATAIEYGLIAALISVSIIAGATTVGTTLGEYFQDIVGYF